MGGYEIRFRGRMNRTREEELKMTPRLLILIPR